LRRGLYNRMLGNTGRLCSAWQLKYCHGTQFKTVDTWWTK